MTKLLTEIPTYSTKEINYPNKFVNKLIHLSPKLHFYSGSIAMQRVRDFESVYEVTKDRIILPEIQVEHEIAHMVEMSNLQRCLLPDWGLISLAVENSTKLARISRK